MSDAPLGVPERRAILDELRRRGFRPSRKRGQNFLFDRQLLQAFLDDAEVAPGDTILEVGAGAGTLTRVLLDRGCRVLSVEIDTILARYLIDELAPRVVRADDDDPVALSADDRLVLFVGDALESKNRLHPRLAETWARWTADVLDTDGRLVPKLVSNLPYAIATPIVQLVTGALEPPVAAIGVLVQAELAERWRAEPGSSDYGSVTVWMTAIGEGRITRRVKPGLFSPPPAVDSAFFHWVRTADSPTAESARRAHAVARDLFLHRRKMLRVLLKDRWPGLEPRWEEWGIRPEMRPGDLGPGAYRQLADAIAAAESS